MTDLWTTVPSVMPVEGKIWYAIIANTIDSFGDQVEVIIPDFDDHLTWGPAFWNARNQVDLPQAGDECLVVFDNNRQPWVVSWWPAGGGSGDQGEVYFTGHWNWQTATGAPNTGHVRVDGATWSASTHVLVNKTTANGVDVTTALATINAHDDVYLQDAADSTKWGRFDISGLPTDMGSYLSYPVSFINGAGTVPGNSRDTIVAIIKPSGGGGGSGGGDLSYTHTQSVLSASWVVVHNLGKNPAVEVVDSGDSVVIADVHYDSLNQLTITLGAATSGKAYLN